MRYTVRFVHKISPRDTDTAGPVEILAPDTFKMVAADLRQQGILGKGERLLPHSRRELDGRIVCFPCASIWHSIILVPIREGE